MMNRFPNYLQHDAMDCGPTCLRMIAKYYGKNYSLHTLRERSFITREGVSMHGKLPMQVTGEIGNRLYMYSSYIRADETFCYDKASQKASKLLLTYPENTLDIPEDAAFKPRTILENKYLVDWEQPDNDENPILVMVEP